MRVSVGGLGTTLALVVGLSASAGRAAPGDEDPGQVATPDLPGDTPPADPAAAPDPGDTPPPTPDDPGTLDLGMVPVGDAGDQLPAQQIDLDTLLNITVVSSTKTKQRAAQTPAVVTVISNEEIRARGYATLADVLRTVPGFYDVYDLASHNVGVRGINGGARASGNVLKVMIDGHPVDFRPTTGNFYGLELIPLAAVERVEVIRGPASALYGANAFLGVVNIITKSGFEARGARGLGRVAVIQGHPGGGGGLTLGGSEGAVDVMFAGELGVYERSGLPLPDSSPRFALLSSRGDSFQDFYRPRSMVGKVSLEGVAGGRLTALAMFQNLESRGEFQDFGPLSHGTRIGLINQNYRLSYEVLPTKKTSVNLSAHYLTAYPAQREKLDIARDDYLLLRSVGVEGFGVNLEGRVEAHKRVTFTAGADLVQEDHLLQTFDQKLTQDVRSEDGTIIRKIGTIIPGEAHGDHETFRNIGVFAQGVVTISPSMTAIAGARIDNHSIYGNNFSARAGFVFAPPSGKLSGKLLYGSSFKAPSAVQLFTQPIQAGDIQGACTIRTIECTLEAQTAQTIELAAGYALPGGKGEVTLNLFGTLVSGRVEFQRVGLFQVARNLVDDKVVGGELDSRFVVRPELIVRLKGGVAFNVRGKTGDPTAEPPKNQLFPDYQAHVIVDYNLPLPARPRASIEASYIGPRTASQSNALLSLDGEYTVPGYVYTAAVLSADGKWRGRETSVALRVTDVVNQKWTEPGFGGIDFPTQGISAMLTLEQQL